MLLIDKPRGITSFAVVAQTRRQLNVKRVGHAGTLDPLASGLLIVFVGREETKQQDRFMKLAKEYEVTIALGKTSTTDDAEGRITENAEMAEYTEEEMTEKVKKFIGEIQQTPPLYSAIHIGGERAYKLARRGETVAMPTRTVTIHDIEILQYAWPIVSLRVQCSHGTYIRSLARDLGGYVTVLRRTKIGDYKVLNAISPDQITTAQNRPLTLE